jgi:hypothetical protein
MILEIGDILGCVQAHFVIVTYYILSLFVHDIRALVIVPLLVVLFLLLLVTSNLSLLIITLVAILLAQVSLGGSLAASSESVSVLPQGKDDRDEYNSQETQKRVTPIKTQGVEHLAGEKRESSSKAGTEEIVTSRDGSELCRVGITEVVQDTRECTKGTDGEERSTDDGNNPVNRCLGSPTKHEQTERQTDTGGQCRLQSDLRTKSSILREARLDVVVVVVPVRRNTDDTTDTDTEVAQASGSETELVDVFESEGN